MSQLATKPKKREVTRARVIQAAIDSIYSEGFHAAHTNRIAEEAGVSWGVLQYHFGDKDGLLQAVLDHIFANFADSLACAELNEVDLRDRIDGLVKLLWSLVSKPEYRVSVAILRNAGRDPESKVDGSRQMDTWSKEIGRAWDELFADVDTPAPRSSAARRLMFASLRGLADEINPSGRSNSGQLREEFNALGDAIYHLLTN